MSFTPSVLSQRDCNVFIVFCSSGSLTDTHATLLRSCLAEVGLPMDDAPRYHLLDVWKGRIYGVYAFDHAAKLSKCFEESAAYRLELAPLPIEGLELKR